MVYGFYENYADQLKTDMGTASLVCFAYLTPLAGIGYFLIFLRMHPRALEHFKASFCSCCLLEPSDSNVSLLRMSRFDNNPSQNVFGTTNENWEDGGDDVHFERASALSKGTTQSCNEKRPTANYDDMNDDDLLDELSRLNTPDATAQNAMHL